MRMLPLLVVFAVLAAGIGYALAAKGQRFLRCDSAPTRSAEPPTSTSCRGGQPCLG